MISKQLQKKLDYYEQAYFSLDKPIPFKGDLILYPVPVSQYYEFYGSIPCLTQDKNIITVIGEDGRPKKISNPKGISQSYLTYLIEQMESKEKGQETTAQVMQLLELVLHIKRGFYCPHCKKEVPYTDAFEGMEEYVQDAKTKFITEYSEAVKRVIESGKTVEEDLKNPPEDIMNKVELNAKAEFFHKAMRCPDCEQEMRDIFAIKSENGKKTLVIRDVEINSKEFDEFKALVPRQNILDYDGDKYMNPDLKEELELKAQLQNKDYTSPTLEKQLVCVAVGTGYTFEYLHTLSIRKLNLLLRTVDAEKTYYAQLQASLSGFVKFKEDPKHWIFSENKRSIKDELTEYSQFEKKFAHVT